MPVISTRMADTGGRTLPRRSSRADRDLEPNPLQVGVDHHRHELGEIDPWPPAEFFAGLGGVAVEEIDLGGAEKSLIDADVFLPIEAGVRKRHLDELLDRVRVAGGDQFQGSSSAGRLIGWAPMRAITSVSHASGSTPLSRAVRTSV